MVQYFINISSKKNQISFSRSGYPLVIFCLVLKKGGGNYISIFTRRGTIIEFEVSNNHIQCFLNQTKYNYMDNHCSAKT